MSPGNAIVLVDAGFLIKALVLNAGKTTRKEVAVDYEALAEALTALAEEATSRPVLRQTWYDGAYGARARPEHRALAAVAGVHVRLGWTIATDRGVQQKGVDTLMVRDMVVAALNGVADDLVLIAGDGDLVPGVREAADRGIRIHLWGVSPDDSHTRQSEELIALADRRLTLELADLSPHVQVREEAQPTDTVPLVGTAPPASQDPVVLEPVFEVPADVPPAEGDMTTDANVLPSAPAHAEPARLGPPSLRQLSTAEQHEADLAEDIEEALTAADLGVRYGSRWWSRAPDEVRERLLDVGRPPRLPRRLDLDLLAFARERAINIDDEPARHDLRAGFWTGIAGGQGDDAGGAG